MQCYNTAKTKLIKIKLVWLSYVITLLKLPAFKLIKISVSYVIT